MIAASIASGAIGFGADFIITDDPHNPSDVYSKNRLASTTNSFKHNIFSRLNDQKTSSMIVVMQRLHVDDLTGNLLKNNNWNQLSLPLINQVDQVFKIFDKEISIRKGDILHADIFDLKTIDDLRADIGLHNFDAQYQQSPNARDFSMVNEDMIRYYDNNSEENFIENNKQNFIENHSKNEEIIGNSNVFHEISSTDCKNCQKNALFEKNNPKQYIENFSKPSENALKCDVKKHDFSSNGSNDTQLRWSNRKIIHSWDTANSAQKNNFTVGTTWEIKDDHYYLIDLYRDQVDYVDLKKNVINQHEKYGGIILIEDKASGSALIQDLSTTTDLSIIKCTPLVSKESRLLKVLHFFERGEIFFPKNARWLEDLKNELLRFPHSKYDDQVDSITQFFLWAEKQRDKIRVIDKRISLMGM